MRHLNPEQLLDVAEGTAEAGIVAHAASCAPCTAEVARLHAMRASLSDVEVPEPSPLFWEHLSARVRDAIVADVAPGPRIVRRPWTLTAAAAVAILAITAAVSWRVHAPGQGSGSTVANDMRTELRVSDAVPVALVEDASLDLLADLAAGLDWDDAAEAGLAVSAGSVDCLVVELTATEREELHRLLTVEMAGKVL